MPSVLSKLSPFQGVLLLLGLLALSIAAYFALALQDVPQTQAPSPPPVSPVVAAIPGTTPVSPSAAPPLAAFPLLTEPEESDAENTPPYPGLDQPAFQPAPAAIKLRREPSHAHERLHPEARASLLRIGISPHPFAATPHARPWPDGGGSEGLAQANRLIGEQRWAEALAAYRVVWQESPALPELAFNLAVCLDHLGRREEAAQAYQQALTLTRDHPSTLDSAAIVARLAELALP